MKKLKNYINEKQNFLIKNKNVLKDYDHYEYHPITKKELENIIIELLKQGETNLNCIDVSNITDMSNLFHKINYYIDGELTNINISEWDVSNVINMSYMFYECMRFNADLSIWDVSNVKNMGGMFSRCKEFNSDISNWDVSNVTDMRYMFNECKKFNADLSNWDVNNTVNTYNIFKDCYTLKKNNKIPEWYDKE